ncbi:hypothetical protein SAMN06298216_1857 [Spirosomataceae bacterium TFI 002]|nr:hypothetical protein SAMN06298216_1857 [Spirosomataceae bacterium TFI 002]
MKVNNLELAESEVSESGFKNSLWYVIPVVLMLSLLVSIAFNYHEKFTWVNISNGFDTDFFIFLMIGVFAQLVDGTLGMGYGATSTSFLLSFGVSPVISSMGVHVAEMFTTGASAISHYKFKNIDKKLVIRLILPGVLGSFVGAYLLADVIDGKAIKPYIAVYMIILAVTIVIKGLRKNIVKRDTKRIGLLAVFGGFMDAVGGGGWGPIVTSTLMSRGGEARYTIGSVNTAEFAISFASGVTFILFGGISGWRVIAGLIIGGIIAAPIGAFLVNKIPTKSATILVGLLLIALSLRTLLSAF